MQALNVVSLPNRRKQRRTDLFANIAELIGLFPHLPQTVQNSLADNLLRAIEHLHNRQRYDYKLKSLGRMAILTLYKSHRKLRKTDGHNRMHRAVTWMNTMPEEALAVIDNRCMVLNRYLRSLTREEVLNEAMLELKVSYCMNGLLSAVDAETGSHLMWHPDEDPFGTDDPAIS